jgi:predicted CoA-binding protein
LTEAETVRQILQTCRTVAVVGLSPKPHRDSYGIARYMQAQGWRIVPVNPNAREALGEPAYASLTEAAQALAAQGQKIDLVNCFRNSEDIPPIVDEAIAIGAKAVWMQFGIEHETAADKARAAGLLVVEDRCLKVDHAAARWRD